MDKLMPDIKNWGCGNYKLTSAHAAKHVMGGWAYKLRMRWLQIEERACHKTCYGLWGLKIEDWFTPPPKKKTRIAGLSYKKGYPQKMRL